MVKFLFIVFLSSLAFADLHYLAKSVGPQTSFENVSTNFYADTHTSGAEYDDAVDENVAIGFAFPFNGTVYTHLNIDSNGHLAFVGITSEYVNQSLPRGNREQSIYPYWDDLNLAAGGSIRYGTLGSGEEERFVVYWNDVPRYGSNNKRYTFQVVLYKNGNIRFRYDSASVVDGSSATVGVQESSTYYDEHVFNTTSGFNAEQDILYRPLLHLNSIVPECADPVAKIEMSTYDISGVPNHPIDEYQFNELIQTYATENNLFGSGYKNAIDGEKNPYGSNDYYLTIFKGYIYLPTTGTYKFGVDGDDAVEVYMDDKLITGWYGGHGMHNSVEYAIDIDAQSGWHKLEFHQEQIAGGNNYYLYWQQPNGSMEKVPKSRFFHCEAKVIVTKNSEVISDPINGTENPKRIPGAVVRYSILANNIGKVELSNAVLADSLESSLEWVGNSLTVTTPDINGGAIKSLSDASDGDEGTFDGSTAEVNCQTLKKNEACLVTFDVTVK